MYDFTVGVFLLFPHEVFFLVRNGEQKWNFMHIYVYIMYLINEIICIFSSTYCKLMHLFLLIHIYANLIVLVANVVCYSYLSKLFLSYLILSRRTLHNIQDLILKLISF